MRTPCKGDALSVEVTHEVAEANRALRDRARLSALIMQEQSGVVGQRFAIKTAQQYPRLPVVYSNDDNDASALGRQLRVARQEHLYSADNTLMP
jgi:hypothetical protein